MAPWHTEVLDVRVDHQDFMDAKEKAIERGADTDILTIVAEVDIEEALEYATVDELRQALAREEQDRGQGNLDAIRDCFAALARGDINTATALLGRVFEHSAQIAAADAGLHSFKRAP